MLCVEVRVTVGGVLSWNSSWIIRVLLGYCSQTGLMKAVFFDSVVPLVCTLSRPMPGRQSRHITIYQPSGIFIFSSKDKARALRRACTFASSGATSLCYERLVLVTVRGGRPRALLTYKPRNHEMLLMT